MTGTTQGRRRLPPPPGNLSVTTWGLARGWLARWARELPNVIVGIVGAFKRITPTTIQAGVPGSAGDENDSWMSASAVIAIETAPIGSILLGTTAAEGTGTALARADGRNETIQLLAQVRNIASYQLQ